MWRPTALQNLNLLNSRQKSKILMLAVCTSALGLIDLIAISIIGALAISFSGTANAQSSSMLSKTMSLFFDSKWLSNNIFLLLLVSLSLLVFKSICSLILNYVMYTYLGQVQSAIAIQTLKRIMSLPLNKIQQLQTQRVSYALTSGIDSAISITISSLLILTSDVLLVMLLLIPLFLFSPLLTFFICLYFSLIALLVLKGLTPAAHKAGEIEADSEIKSMQLFKLMISGYREIIIGAKYSHFENETSDVRTLASKSFGKRLFFQQIPKFVFEFSLVFGSLFFFLIQRFMGVNSREIVASLVLFFVASFRFAPSMLRIQTASLVIKSTSGVAQSVQELIMGLPEYEKSFQVKSNAIINDDIEFSPEVVLSNVNFSYPQSNFKLRNISIEIPARSSLAIVGPSGSGKSTLVDLLLGLNRPDSGKILISGQDVGSIKDSWRDKIFYVPQDISILSGTIRDNLAFEPNADHSSDHEMLAILKAVHLSELFQNQELDLDSTIGEGALNLSGGERQRLGIARAIFSGAEIIVLDESTSALDSNTEAVINLALKTLRLNCTLIVIAHRLSSIMDFDQIVYLSSGEVKGVGSFSKLRQEIQEFEMQCTALGL